MLLFFSNSLLLCDILHVSKKKRGIWSSSFEKIEILGQTPSSSQITSLCLRILSKLYLYERFLKYSNQAANDFVYTYLWRVLTHFQSWVFTACFSILSHSIDMFFLQIAIDKDNLDKAFIQLTIEFMTKLVNLYFFGPSTFYCSNLIMHAVSDHWELPLHDLLIIVLQSAFIIQIGCSKHSRNGSR